MKYLDKRDNRDIIDHIHRQYLIKGIACAFLSLGIAAFFAVYAYSYFADRLGVINGVAACLIGMAIPFFALKLHKDVLDRSWEGEIVSRKTRVIATRGGGTRFNKLTRSAGYDTAVREYIILTVNTGSDIVILDRPAGELSRFGVGDRLRHIRGTKYLQACRRDNTTRDCVMCGAIIRESGDTCPHCGMSLVKFDPPRAWAEQSENESIFCRTGKIYAVYDAGTRRCISRVCVSAHYSCRSQSKLRPQ